MATEKYEPECKNAFQRSQRDTNRCIADDRESQPSTGHVVEGECQQRLEPAVVFLLDQDVEDKDEEVVGDGHVDDEPVEEPKVADCLAINSEPAWVLKNEKKALFLTNMV